MLYQLNAFIPKCGRHKERHFHRISFSLVPVIVVKPKNSTLFSLGVFIVICLGISGYMLPRVLEGGRVEWYEYLFVIVPGPIALGLMTKTIFGYKKVEVGQERISISYPIRSARRVYPLKEIDRWTEHEVKTAGSKFKELNVYFKNGKKLALSLQEHDRYADMIKYLRKKCAKKFVKQP